jgi:hypothetical protein
MQFILISVGSKNLIQLFQTAMTEISEYAIDAGLHLSLFASLTPIMVKLSWLKMARKTMGRQVLRRGLDRSGSADHNWQDTTAQRKQNSDVSSPCRYRWHSDGTYPPNHDEAAACQKRDWKNLAPLRNNSLTVFTSDYVLYWFDYLADTTLCLHNLGGTKASLKTLTS